MAYTKDIIQVYNKNHNRYYIYIYIITFTNSIVYKTIYALMTSMLEIVFEMIWIYDY